MGIYRRWFRRAGLTAAIAICTLSISNMTGLMPAKAYAAAETGAYVTKEEAVKAQTAVVASMKTAESASQIVMVEGLGGSQVKVAFYKKGESGEWNQEFSVDGVYGKNGGSYEKKEGDGKTPLGVYSFSMAFGLKKDPDSLLPYHQIQSGDYWVDDGKSSHYNKLVNSKKVKKDWKSAENMASQAPYYNYGLVLNYNEDCVPGKGSAIFLHCTKSEADTGSAGCVRIPEEYVKMLVQTVSKDTKIVLVSDESQMKDF